MRFFYGKRCPRKRKTHIIILLSVFSFLVITSGMLNVIKRIIHFQVPRYNIVHNLVYVFNFIAAPYEAMIATVFKHK